MDKKKSDLVIFFLLFIGAFLTLSFLSWRLSNSEVLGGLAIWSVNALIIILLDVIVILLWKFKKKVDLVLFVTFFIVGFLILSFVTWNIHNVDFLGAFTMWFFFGLLFMLLSFIGILMWKLTKKN